MSHSAFLLIHRLKAELKLFTRSIVYAVDKSSRKLCSSLQVTRQAGKAYKVKYYTNMFLNLSISENRNEIAGEVAGHIGIYFCSCSEVCCKSQPADHNKSSRRILGLLTVQY